MDGTLQQLGKYQILEEVGRGGFATVYRAFDTVLHRNIALKILHPALASDPEFVTRFENDARASAQLDHPHIVTVYELGQLAGRLYIALPFMPGGTLADRIREAGAIPMQETTRIVGEIADALEQAHIAGLVHR
ncbi:MAG: serine/threonine-protein kinase, partial [Ardenticatenaceae bacterium]